MSILMAIPVHRLNEVVRGKRGVTADTALRLAKLLGRSAEFWLTLQTNCDLWHAAFRSTFSVTDPSTRCWNPLVPCVPIDQVRRQRAGAVEDVVHRLTGRGQRRHLHAGRCRRAARNRDALPKFLELCREPGRHGTRRAGLGDRPASTQCNPHLISQLCSISETPAAPFSRAMPRSRPLHAHARKRGLISLAVRDEDVYFHHRGHVDDAERCGLPDGIGDSLLRHVVGLRQCGQQRFSVGGREFGHHVCAPTSRVRVARVSGAHRSAVQTVGVGALLGTGRIRRKASASQKNGTRGGRPRQVA